MDATDDKAAEAKPPDSEFDEILSGLKKKESQSNNDKPKASSRDPDAESFLVHQDTSNGSGSLTLSIGTKVEVKDFDDGWSPADILEVDQDEMEVLVHYDAIKRHDEWVSVNSPRIRPFTRRPDNFSPIVQLNDCLDMPEQKSKQYFLVGERCLARWHNNTKFTATVQQVLDNDKYEVMFDDGSTWKCNAVRLCKLKSEPSSASSTPEPSTGKGISPSDQQAQHAQHAQHKHLFDPTLDYLGSKSERREKKRKLNIKELFNIGQKRYCKRISKVNRAQVAKPETSDLYAIDDSDYLVSKKNSNRTLSPEPEDQFLKFEHVNDDKHNETISTMKQMISKLEDTLSQANSDIDNIPSPKPAVIKLEIEPVTTEIKLEMISKEKTLEIDVKENIVNSKQITNKIEEISIKTEKQIIKDEIIMSSDESTSITNEVPIEVKNKTKQEIVKMDDEMNVVKVPSMSVAQRVLAEKRRLEKIKRLKRARKIRLLRENKVKKEMEKVKSELEEMKKQVMAMKREVHTKKKKQQPLIEPETPEQQLIDPATLTPQQWCCRWVADHPQGKEFDDIEGFARYIVQVDDHRIPPTFTKLLMRRSKGHSAGKWDVVYVGPDKRRIHNKLEMKMYLENLNDESIKSCEYALLDFSLHRRLSRNVGWDDSPKQTKGIKIKIRKRDLAIVKKAPKRKHKKKDTAESRKSSSSLKPLSAEMTAKLLTLKSNSLATNYTLCGVLKAELHCNMLRCPANDCLKNFRTIILLQMHIKYYHKDLVELMGASPTVHELATHNVLPDYQPSPKPKHKHKRDDNQTLRPSGSPKSRKPAAAPNKKRPRVLLPVRDVQPRSVPRDSLSELDDSECAFREEFEKKFPAEAGLAHDLDFEAAISAHTVCKVKKRGRAKLPSDEDDLYSDLETQSSFARSGTPDSKMLQHMEAKGGELYYTSETGEKIKIVHMKREEIINCHCGFREEDGLMIQCELCLCWQHAICHNIHKESEVPEKYTCSICLNPRRGRRSRRFVHDQDRLYEGLLTGAAPCPKLRRAHELTGNLLRLHDALHALRVKRRAAESKNHPKLYLWAWEWEQELQDKTTDFDLHAMIDDIHQPEQLQNLEDMRIPSDDLEDQRLSQKSSGSLSNLLSSPGGTTFDLPITTCELEKLAKAVEEPLPPASPAAPQPDAPIDDATSRHNLYLHVQRCQASIDARLDSLEAQVAELESQEPSMVDDETAEYFPRTKQTVQMLLRDLASMEELGLVS